MGGRLQEFDREYWVYFHRRREIQLISLRSSVLEDLEGAKEFLPQFAAGAIRVEVLQGQVCKVAGAEYLLWCSMLIGLFFHH